MSQTPVKVVSRMSKKRPFRVSVEGNIGSGKSTCIKYFEKFKNVEVHPEPLSEWRDVCGHNLLSLLYSDMGKWSFTFQHYVHLSRLKIQTSPPSNPNITVKMFERSVQNSRHCFVENAKKEKYLQESEYNVLQAWFEFTERHLDIDLDLIVYLRSTPEIVLERILKRGRSEESEIPLEYLQKVHEAYERWLGGAGAGAGGGAGCGCEVVVVDADQGVARVLHDLQQLQPRIVDAAPRLHTC